MIYVGIVGALSPLGQKVARFLKEQSDLYRIVFYVDAGYRVSSPSLATYASPEAALSFNQPPTLIIDCDDPITAIERAKTYRFYAVSAIVCCTCLLNDLELLQCSYVAENQPVPALLITPDYVPGNIALMRFFLGIAAKHREDVDRLEIEVALPSQKKINLTRWLYFGELMNEKFGKPNAKYSVKGNVCNFGNVIIKAVNDDNLTDEAQDVSVRLYYGSKQHLCYTFMKSSSNDRIRNSVSGIKMMLEWFVSHSNEISDGGIFPNHLCKIMNDKRKNLL